MADNIALMLLGIKDYDIENIKDKYDKNKHYKVISLKYSGNIPDACPVCGTRLYGHGKRNLQVMMTIMNPSPILMKNDFQPEHSFNSCSAQMVTRTVFQPLIATKLDKFVEVLGEL